MSLRIVISLIFIFNFSCVYSYECPVDLAPTFIVDTTNIQPFPELTTYTEYKAVVSSCYCMLNTTVVADNLASVLQFATEACTSYYQAANLPPFEYLEPQLDLGYEKQYRPRPINTTTESAYSYCNILVNPSATQKLSHGIYKTDSEVIYIVGIGDTCPTNTSNELTLSFNEDTDKTCYVPNAGQCLPDYELIAGKCQPKVSNSCPNYICPDGYKLRDIIPQSGGQTYTTCSRPPVKNCSNNEPYLVSDVCPEDQVCTDEASCKTYQMGISPCTANETFIFNYTSPTQFTSSCSQNTTPTTDTTNTTSGNQVVDLTTHSLLEDIKANTLVNSGVEDQLRILKGKVSTATNQLNQLAEQQKIANTLSELKALNQAILTASLDRNSNLANGTYQIGTINPTSADSTLLTDLGSKVDLTNTKLDSTNTKLDGIKDLLTTTVPVNGSPTGFSDSESELTAKKQEFSNYINTQKDRITSLFDINNISFSGSLPNMSFQVLAKTFTVDTTWIEYILTFLGVLVVVWAYYDALIIVLGG